MDWNELNEYLDTLEWMIPRLEEVRRMPCDLEVDELLREMRKEARRVREEIGRIQEEETEALRREYERSVL